MLLCPLESFHCRRTEKAIFTSPMTRHGSVIDSRLRLPPAVKPGGSNAPPPPAVTHPVGTPKRPLPSSQVPSARRRSHDHARRCARASCPSTGHSFQACDRYRIPSVGAKNTHARIRLNGAAERPDQAGRGAQRRAIETGAPRNEHIAGLSFLASCRSPIWHSLRASVRGESDGLPRSILEQDEECAKRTLPGDFAVATCSASDQIDTSNSRAENPSPYQETPGSRVQSFAKTSTHLKIISLFSGAGGLDLGLAHAGHKVVWANDIDADAVATYRRNLDGEIAVADIAKVDARRLPHADVVVGGFPCQGFSQANMKRREGDVRNALFSQFVRVLRAKQPRYFIAENVRGLLSLAGGALLARILKSMQLAGYRVEYRVLNAADFGVPQNRHRVIFLGTHRDEHIARTLAFPAPTHANPSSAHCTGLSPWIGVGEALAAIPDVGAPHDLPNHVCSQYKVAYRNFTGHRVTDPAKPSPTILARGNGKGGVCAIPHPFFPRRMSVRESAAVQTFPLDFEFSGALNSMYRQVGNAVPVRLAYRLGGVLSEAARRSTR